MEMTFVNESLNFSWQCFCLISVCYMPPVAPLTQSTEATHKTVCHLHLEHGYQLCSLFPHRTPHTAFAWAFSCLCLAWPCSSHSRLQKPNQRQLSRGTVCSNQVTGLFRNGSEIIASRSQGREWPLSSRLDRILAQSDPAGLSLWTVPSLQALTLW